MELRPMMMRALFAAPECPRRGRCRNGFTLIELLVVMAIITILLTLAIPAATSFRQGNNIAVAGQSVADQIAVARQIAASRNQAIEVRFITPTAWATQGATSYTGYHAIQLWSSNEAGTSTVALNATFNLPVGIEISAGTKLSPILTTYAQSPIPMPAGATAGSYVSFFVRPNGNVVSTGTTAPPANGNGSPIQSYFFTVVPVQNDSLNTLPKNYAALQVNPDTARTTAYRP